MPVDELTSLCARVLRRCGATETQARLIAGVLVRTTARGYASHGVALLPLYAGWAHGGVLDPSAEPEEVYRSDVAVTLDAHRAFGQLAAVRAADAVIELASRRGLGFVSVRNSNHIGALGYYALTCAEAGLVGVVWSSAPPTMHAPGGIRRVMGNGPVAWAAPREGGDPLVFDAALSTGAGGKVALARQRGEQLPAGWIIDQAGRPSTDPQDAPTGAFVPLGSHKGFGLALLGEILSTCLSGATPSPLVPPMGAEPARPFGLGHAILALQPSLTGAPGFAGRVVELCTALTAAVDSTAAAGELRLPGEAAAERERTAARAGIGLRTSELAAITALLEG
jgi:ureidoglycolate dehydrogenase (NAD+)